MAPSEQTKTEEQKLGMLPNAAGEWPIVPMPPRSENPGVGGSIPSLPTIFLRSLIAAIADETADSYEPEQVRGCFVEKAMRSARAITSRTPIAKRTPIRRAASEVASGPGPPERRRWGLRGPILIGAGQESVSMATARGSLCTCHSRRHRATPWWATNPQGPTYGTIVIVQPIADSLNGGPAALYQACGIAPPSNPVIALSSARQDLVTRISPGPRCRSEKTSQSLPARRSGRFSR